MKVELILPCWDREKADYAFMYWADSIYCWVAMFALRTRMNTITEADIEDILCKKPKWKKVYITLNWFPHQKLIPHLRKHLEFLKRVKPDWLIIADAWILNLANEICPHIPKHLSVQASTVSAEGLKFWHRNWINRIILAREIPISEVAQIHDDFPGMELEYFVHWAVCMAYSGRCLLSNFMAQRDSNRWMCAHSCRWKYKVYLEEELREGQFIPIEEDEHWTHIMSSRDMCMIEHLKEIIDSWVTSLKVEGRNKTIYYLATVARAYRQALNDIDAWKQFDMKLFDEIHATANRWFFAWFLHGKPNVEWQQYEANRSTSVAEFAWKVLDFYPKWGDFEENTILFEVKNRIDTWSEIRFMYPNIDDDVITKADVLIKNWKQVHAVHWWDWSALMQVPGLTIMKWVLMRQAVQNDGLKEL